MPKFDAKKIAEFKEAFEIFAMFVRACPLVHSHCTCRLCLQTKAAKEQSLWSMQVSLSAQLAKIQQRYTSFANSLKIITNIRFSHGPQDQIEKWKKELDSSGSGFFDWDTFIAFLEKNWDDTDVTAQITEAFHVFDEDGSGAISAAELKHVMTNLGEKLTEKEIDSIFLDGDVDGAGQIDYAEFMVLMKG